MKMPKYFYTEEKSTGEIIVHKRNARMIAEMASRGHITSINKYIRQAGNRWLLTRSGAELASSYEHC